VAQLTINTLQAALNAGEGRSVYKDYIIALNRYLIPFFGKYNMDSIDYELLKQFDAWRSQKMGKTPTASTVGTHVSAINRVFDEGIERAVACPRDYHWNAPHPGREPVVHGGDLAFMGEVDPVLFEDVFHLELEQCWICEDVPAAPEGSGMRIIDNRSLDPVSQRCVHGLHFPS
jgi:hypothetical protein